MASGRLGRSDRVMTTWRDLARVLDTQHGVVGRIQLDDLAVSKARLQHWVRTGRLERVAPRVWRLAGAPATWEQRLHVGLLALGRMSWVSHDAAAQLHRFDRAPLGNVEFLVVRRRKSADFEGVVHSTRRWGPSDEVMIDGLRVTSATRTILDLANVQVHPDRLKAAIDSAVRQEASSPEVLRRRLEAIRGRGRTGVRMIDRLLEDSGGHTMLERKFLELMSRAGLPRPEPQVVFRDGSTGRTIARVDFLYRDFDLVVEVSGRLGHSSPSERARDAHRRNELQSLGLLVYEFTWEDVTERAGWVIAEMRAALRARSSRSGPDSAA